MSTSIQKKAGEGVGFLSDIQTLEWKRLRLIHIFSKSPKLFWYISCSASRATISGVRRMPRTKRSWIPSGMSDPAWDRAQLLALAEVRTPLLAFPVRLCPDPETRRLRSGPTHVHPLVSGVLQPRRRELGEVPGGQERCATLGLRSPAVPWGPAVPRAPLLPPLAWQSQRCPLGNSSLMVFPPDVHGGTPEVQGNPSKWTLSVHPSLPSSEQGSSLP